MERLLNENRKADPKLGGDHTYRDLVVRSSVYNHAFDIPALRADAVPVRIVRTLSPVWDMAGRTALVAKREAHVIALAGMNVYALGMITGLWS